MARPIYIAIMAAAERGTGIHLTADEVQELRQDDAIVTRAAVGLPDDNAHVYEDGFSWCKALLSALNRTEDNG